MKKIIIAVAITLLGLSATIANASAKASLCDGSNNQKAAQCIYLTGLTDSDQQRWIRITTDTHTDVVCEGSIEQKNKYTLFTEYYPIQNANQTKGTVSICTDAAGSNCKILKTFSVVCKKAGDCTPATLPIDISTIKNKFPACDAKVALT